MCLKLIDFEFDGSAVDIISMFFFSILDLGCLWCFPLIYVALRLFFCMRVVFWFLQDLYQAECLLLCFTYTRATRDLPLFLGYSTM